jgi:mannose-1-phosphate guanylyltransferase
MIKAMILGAGKGTRVRPLTQVLPKPMIPILGKPVMEYLVEYLARHNVRQIMVNTSHLSERIEQYFGDGRRFDVEIGYSFEGFVEEGVVVPMALGSAGGMRKIQDFGNFFDCTTIVLCGDALVDLDLNLAVAEHRAKGAMVSVVVTEVPREAVPNYGVVVTDDSGRIVSFQEKPSVAEAKSTVVNTGIYIFEPATLQLIPKGVVFDIGSQLFPMIVESGLPFFAQKHDIHWIDIGRVSDYWYAIQRVMRREVSGISMPGRQVRPGLWVGLNTNIDWIRTNIQGPVYVGSNASIESGASIIGPTWIGHGCRIEQGARVTRSVVFEHTRIAPYANVHEQIVSGKYCVSKDGYEVPQLDEKQSMVWGDARVKEAFPVNPVAMTVAA